MVKLSINYINDNGVRQIFSDIKSNLDSINNTATSAYTTANSAYTKANTAYTKATSAYTKANSAYTTANNANNLASLAYAGAITSDSQTFNIDGYKIFNITGGGFTVISNSKISNSFFEVGISNVVFNIRNTANKRKRSSLDLGYNYINLYVSSSGAYLNLTDNGILISDGKGHQGYINAANCV